MVKKYIIPVSSVTHQPILNVVIKGENGRMGTTDLLIDTGAQQTTLDVILVEPLGLDLSKGKKSFITTASGNEEVVVVTVPLLKIGEIELLDHPVCIHDFKSFYNASGVLGMDVISMYNFTLNQKDRVAIFEEF